MLSDITQISDTEYKVLGSTTVNDLCEYFNLGTVDSESATVGGWVIDMLGKVPDMGDELTYGNLQITVAKTEFRRITELKVVVLSETEESKEEE